MMALAALAQGFSLAFWMEYIAYYEPRRGEYANNDTD